VEEACEVGGGIYLLAVANSGKKVTIEVNRG